VRELAPREAPLAPLPPEQLIDPASVRPDFAPIRPTPRITSRVLGSATSFGLVGRLAVTAVVVLMLPVSGWTAPLGFVSAIGAVPIAFIVLRSTWAPTLVDADRVFTLPPERTRTVLRCSLGFLGAAIATVGLASGGPWFSAVPGIFLTAVAATPPTWSAVTLGLGEMQEHPIQQLVAVNVLNLLDVVASDAAIRAGQANELNPFVGATGTGIKLATVAVCSLLLYRLRPKALIWPAFAFAVLAVYHLTGWLVMA
jgi:hypothetical protein